MNDLIKTALELIKAENSLVMATIVRHKGSTPRETGTRFIIKSDGSAMGTVGGGLVEAEVIERGRRLFATKKSTLLVFDTAAQHLNSAAMICGGNMTILLDYMEPDPVTLSLLQAIEQSLVSRSKSTMILELREESADCYRISRGLVNDSGTITGDLSCTDERLQQIWNVRPDTASPSLLTLGDCKYWVEPLLFPKRLLLFGAGHVARPTAQLGVMTGFQTLVVDDRPELLTREFFPEPVECIPVESFDSALKSLEVNRDCFLVILTRSHLIDKSVLSQALQVNAGYYGMIGSRKKRDTIYKALIQEGFSQNDLDKVHSPIGLDIGANTPEEIAVSIISELIQVRSRE